MNTFGVSLKYVVFLYFIPFLQPFTLILYSILAAFSIDTFLVFSKYAGNGYFCILRVCLYICIFYS